ncbi:hypothetical protein NLJ89_g7447 [Agrocybe chaxingu]|uniref:Uncharacterized protein n=1 Tax=Agrocybe chaxingu TaxID=84603 RepID=A0A9W8MTP3_9AGAR|nr:hypothetical protein NLJ89_g7447 [Agrocybe chaxingu]
MASSYTTASDGTDDGRPTAEELKERYVPVVLITTTTSPLSATRTDDFNHPRSHLSRDALRVHFKHESDLVVDHDSEPHVYGESPPEEGDDDAEVEADRLMSLSTSSITLLRTPHNEVLNNSDAEDLQTRLHDLLHGVGSLAPSSSGPLDLLPPRADNLDAVPPSRLSVTETEVSRLSDMPSVRPTRRRINTRVDTAHISQHVVDEMRKVLVEVVSRVFVQLVSDVPLPSSSSLSVPLVTGEGTHIEETPSVQIFSALNKEISRESDDGAGLHEEGGQEEKLGDGGRAT